MGNEADWIWNFPFTLAPVQQRLSASTWNNRLETPSWIIATSTPGANKIAEYCLVTADSDNPIEIKVQPGTDEVNAVFSYVNILSGFMGIYTNFSPNNRTATTYAGIEFGSKDSTPPFTSITASGGAIQLRWVGSTDSWEMHIDPGDGVTPSTTVPLKNVTGIYTSNKIPHGALVDLVYDPIQAKCYAAINGVVGASYSGISLNGIFNFGSYSPHIITSGIFCTTGTSGSGSVACWYGNFTHTLVGVKPGKYFDSL